MTTAVQHRRGTTAEHSTFTGLEGEVTIDTTKDTAVIHDGALAGGYPLAKETLSNANPTTLGALDGASSAADDLFLVYDSSASQMKKMTRAELNNAITVEALDNVDINGGTIDGTAIGSSSASTGAFTTLSTSGAATLNSGTVGGAAIVSVSATQTLTNKTLTSPTINGGSANDLTGLTVDGNTTLGDATTDTITLTGTVQPGVVISGSSSGNALRITQTGTGNALVVEDAANPDSTPFVIDQNGKVLIGDTTSRLSLSAATLEMSSSANYNNGGAPAVALLNYSTNPSFTSGFSAYRANGGVVGTPTAVADAFDLGSFNTFGYDGSGYVLAARILAEVDGTPGSNDMPGRLIFSTTADGASSPTERYRINNAGTHFFGNTTTNTNSTLMVVNGEISETTNSVQYKLVNQSDIGTGPNEIPLNQYLGPLAFKDQLLVAVPSSATAAGNVGDVAADSSYIYVCIAPNSWVRASAAAW